MIFREDVETLSTRTSNFRRNLRKWLEGWGDFAGVEEKGSEGLVIREVLEWSFY